MSNRPASKPKSKRRSPKANWMRKADTAFSKFVRARDGRCLACGSTEFLQCAHIISRSYKAIRVDELNAVCLCRSCHLKFTHKPLEWVEWVEDNYPGRWAELKAKALAYEKVDWRFQSRYWVERLRQQEADV